MAKKQAQAVAVTRSLATHLLPASQITLNGTVDDTNELYVRIEYKRPRTSKFDAAYIPRSRIVSLGYDADGLGYVTYRDAVIEQDSSEVGLDSLVAGYGKTIQSVTAEGYTYADDADLVIYTQYDTQAEEAAPAKTAAPAKGGKGAKAAPAADDAAEETPAPAPTKGGKGGAKGGKGGKPAADNWA